MRSKLIPWLLILNLMVLWPLGAVAQDKKDGKNTVSGPWKIDFDLFHSDDQDEAQPRILVEYKPDAFYSGNEKRLKIGSYYLEAEAEGRIVHAWGSGLNNEPSLINFRFGLLWNMSAVNEVGGLPRQPPSADGESLPALPPTDGGGFVPVDNPFAYNYGKLGLKTTLMLESDDTADNVNMTGGIECAYSSIGAFDTWLLPLPSAWLAYEYVAPQDADARKSLGVKTSAFPRLRAAVLWNWDFGAKLMKNSPVGRQFSFQLHYRYAREYDQQAAWKERKYDEYDQTNLRLIYHFAWAQVKSFGLRDVYAGYSTGRQIAHADDDRRVFVGVTLQ